MMRSSQSEAVFRRHFVKEVFSKVRKIYRTYVMWTVGPKKWYPEL